MDAESWRSFLGLARQEAPVAVVVEGSWWRAAHTARRLARLTATRELGMPDLHMGAHGGTLLLYACPYGAPHAAEVVHVAVLGGVRLVIQIGTCGIVGQGIAPGDVIVPDEALGLDAVTPLYAGSVSVASTRACADLASEGLAARGLTVHRGRTVTWPTLFNQPTDLVRAWQHDGFLGVDMETAATLAVARHFGVGGVSMLVAWDEVLAARTFLDPLPDEQAATFRRSEEAIFEVASELAERLTP